MYPSGDIMLPARFWNNAQGSVAPLAALALVPLIVAAGAAVDYSRASAAHAAFQTALDSTALALSKTASGKSEAELQTAAEQTFKAVLERNDVQNLTVTAAYSSDAGSKLTLTASGSIPADFADFLGVDNIAINATATSTWGNTRLRVALVLDNTGSMSRDDKMTALKTATQNLLTQLQDAATVPDDVYVSIVPFNKDVNVGASNVDATWLRWDLWEAQNGTCSDGWHNSSQSSCTGHGGVWTPAAHSAWNGCVTDRDQNFDTTNDAPGAGATLYPAEQYSSCPAQLMGLSNDWTALSSKVDDMQPNGNTNQAIGLQMGWQSLTAAPFTVPAKDPNYQYTQAIILLSDGLNTQDRWYGNSSSIDARQQTTCDNIKAAGIVIYTVQVNTGGDPTSTLLKNCASDSSKFFLLTSSTQIVTTFNQIGTALSNLRLAM
jgi:Flp pilus assembly protein TadG